MKKSAGILLYKLTHSELCIFLVHPGGPFWKNKDLGSWSIPKGEFSDDEEPLDAAIREFEEETGITLEGQFTELRAVKLKSGKLIYAWALSQEVDDSAIKSNTFDMEWPPGSGKMTSFPEVDQAKWFPVGEALEKINPAQAALIHELVSSLEE
jgi:predicted NUDIX family NTP pyrophosphohydrolase